MKNHLKLFLTWAILIVISVTLFGCRAQKDEIYSNSEIYRKDEIYGEWTADYVYNEDQIKSIIIIKENGTYISKKYRNEELYGHSQGNFVLDSGVLELYKTDTRYSKYEFKEGHIWSGDIKYTKD